MGKAGSVFSDIVSNILFFIRKPLCRFRRLVIFSIQSRSRCRSMGYTWPVLLMIYSHPPPPRFLFIHFLFIQNSFEPRNKTEIKPITMSTINHGSFPANSKLNLMEVDQSSGCAAPSGSFPLPPQRTALGSNTQRRVDNRPGPMGWARWQISKTIIS